MSEEKQITRTINTYHVVIKDAKEGKILKEETSFTKPDRKKLAIAFIKETDNTNFTIDIEETHELRALSLEDFLRYSSVVPPKETIATQENPQPETIAMQENPQPQE